jgi:hypothetical protein
MSETPDHTPVLRASRRALLACGLCFALLLLMGMTGVASITLLYDDPTYTLTGGLEGTVVRMVRTLSGTINVIHDWGGYVGIVLAGWAGLELLALSRRLKATDNPEWRAAARRLPVLGLGGAFVLVVSLLLLIPSGVAAKAFLHSDEPSPIGQPTDRQRLAPRLPGQEVIEDAGNPKFVEWHTRELNYLMALGAILLVFAASTTRRIALEAKRPAPTQPDA